MEIFKQSMVTLVLSLGMAFSTLVCAQDYPARPVRVVLPYSAGSGPDAVVRHVGEKMTKEWGQQLVVDNRPGANGWLAIGETKKSAPDGYTLMTVDATHMTLQPHLYKQLPFDPDKDFELAAPLYFTNFFVVVGANSPWKSMGDLLAAARAKNNEVTYGSWGIGSVAHVGTAMLERAAGIQMRHVPFKELPQLYASVATGEVDWAFGTAATVAPLYKAKRVRLLAYAGPKRMAAYPDVPTVAEAGGPSAFELNTWVAMYAPKGTPKVVLDRIYGASQKALAEPDVRERLATVGFEPWTASLAEAAKTAQADKLRYADIVKKANLSLD